MRAPLLVDLALLAEAEAERRHFDARNFRVARSAWLFFVLLSAVGGLVAASLGAWLAAALAAVNLAALGTLRRLQGHSEFERSFGALLVAALAAETALFMLLPSAIPAAVSFACIVLPVLLLSFRLRFSQAFSIVAVAVLAAGAHGLLHPPPASTDDPPDMPAPAAMAAVGMIGLAAAGLGARATRRRRAELLSELERARTDAHDRLRMREELESARAIQLAMLPASAPAPGWLEVAAASLPATEVGGDYYDYLELGDERLLVAIGDVAGHGVAAGIVLSGVRAGLHLLAGELTRPAEALGRLNRLVRETGPERLLMALGLALFDRVAGRVLWASAGQPPALLFDGASGEVRALAGHQPPLGTRLPVRYEETELALASGDVWLLVSDGVLECRDGRGEPLGEAALAALLAAAAAAGRTARQICDEVLEAIARQRAGADPEDDSTVVVVRRLAP